MSHIYIYIGENNFIITLIEDRKKAQVRENELKEDRKDGKMIK
jgi:hypothetical protein